MPLYEYICQDCGTKFDALRSFREADQPIQCTRCQSQNTNRLLSVFNAHSSGKLIAGTSSGASCSSCAGGDCTHCGH